MCVCVCVCACAHVCMHTPAYLIVHWEYYCDNCYVLVKFVTWNIIPGDLGYISCESPPSGKIILKQSVVFGAKFYGINQQTRAGKKNENLKKRLVWLCPR